MNAVGGEEEASSHAGTGFLRIECVDDFELVAVLDMDERGWCPFIWVRSSRPSSSAGSALEDARV
jgi:hypothetical protein